MDAKKLELAAALRERDRYEDLARACQLKSTADWWLLDNARRRVERLWAEVFDAVAA